MTCKKYVRIYGYFNNGLNLQTLMVKCAKKFEYLMESLKNNPLYSKYLLSDIVRDISYSGSVQVILPYVISKIHCSAKITTCWQLI